MKNEHKEIAWSLYWAQDRLQSCVASGDDADQKRLSGLWQDFAVSLDANSRVLDLATGNGAVPAALLAARADIRLDAVDRAQVDPLNNLSEPKLLKAVRFHPQTDILQLPFDDACFDAITSQFGIEYAGLHAASAAVIPRLKAGGRFQFIVHHADSDIIRSSRLKLIEIEQLIQPGGLLETLIAMLRGDAEFADLETLGKQYLEQDIVRTKLISGQVFSGINQLSENLVSDPKRAMELGTTLDLRIRSEHERLCQMKKAAQTKQDMDQFARGLESMSAQLTALEPIYIDQNKQEYLLAWMAVGVKA
ncbi:MAG: class I SAM-dependent methyltransferase [Gammaproteobacteria bacterium]|nr:class I SAM-dependent methyltransferase [Gammaproteobacteria bacterium]